MKHTSDGELVPPDVPRSKLPGFKRKSACETYLPFSHRSSFQMAEESEEPDTLSRTMESMSLLEHSPGA